MISLTHTFHYSLTDMSNIIITDNSSCLEFLGDYAIKSVEMKSGDELNGEAIMRVLIDDEEYEMRIEMKEGKKEGVGLLLREDGTLFIRMMFVNDECEGEVTKMNKYGRTVLKGRVSKGKEVGMWIEYDNSGNEIWRGSYRNGKRYKTLKHGRCFEEEGGRVVRECVYEDGRMIGVLREWKEELMIEYDKNGKRVYEGGWKGSIEDGFVREGEGKEYGIDGKNALYVGEWKNGLREGKGSEFIGYSPVYIGEWKNGLRHGMGEELNDKGEILRKGRWSEGEYDYVVKRFENRYTTDLSAFDTDCLKGIEKLEIGVESFEIMSQVVIDGLNELRIVIIGEKNFFLNKDIRKGSKCVIMNCDQLNEIHIGEYSFWFYESFELKNLPSLKSIQFDQYAFRMCHSIVFESMNDE